MVTSDKLKFTYTGLEITGRRIGVREGILGNNVASAARLPAPRPDFQPFSVEEARRCLLTAYHRHGPLFELAPQAGVA